jgi:hypothetical protein
VFIRLWYNLVYISRLPVGGDLVAKKVQYKCEQWAAGNPDERCETPTNLEVSFDGGQPVSMCLAHIMLEIQDIAQPAPGGETIDNLEVRRI